MNTKLFFISVILIITGNYLKADSPNNIPTLPLTGYMIGEILDADTDEPVGFATIGIFNAVDSSLVKGSITDKSGKFKSEKLPPGDYFVDVWSIGYGQTRVSEIYLDQENPKFDLGNIPLVMRQPKIEERESAIENAAIPIILADYDTNELNGDFTNQEGPEPTEPEGSESTEPEGPESTEPEGSESTEPEGPESTEPEGSESTEPEGPESTEPEGQDPITGLGEVRDLAVRLFIDCDRCDMNYIREEIPYVNYVRDVKEAQVYLRETSQQTGSGGREYSYTFLGQETFQGMNDTLIYAARPDDTRDYIRRQRTNTMKMGLIRYVAKTPLASEIEINSSAPRNAGRQEEVVDRWNNWVFRVQVRPSYEGEQSYKRLSFRNSISATKITHDWKIDFDYDHNYSRTTYTYDDATFKRYRSSQGLDNLVVKSLGDHWSVGGRLILRSSTFNNVDFNADFFPSLEYNLFPYSESTHRQMRFLYGFGNSFNMYKDSTIYDEIQENRLQQRLQIAYRIEEKWGSVNMSLEGSNYFHDLTKNNVQLNGSIQIRIIKGLSLSLYGSVARVSDQLSLVKGELSEADILLRLQELQTGYQFRGNFGITYTFGSIYNNIVNPRFGSGGGGGGF